MALGRRMATFNRHLTNRLASPRLFRDDRRARVPIPVRVILRLARVSEFLELDASAAAQGPVEDARAVS